MPHDPSPSLAVDLRALVPEATGIGVYTRSLLKAWMGRDGRAVGLAHREIHHRDDLTAAGIDVEDSRSRWPLGVLWQQLELPRTLKRLRDANRAELFWSPLMTLPWSCPVPSVVTVHDLTALLFPDTHRFKVRWSLLPFLNRSLDQARRIVAVSEATARDLAFHFPSCRDRVRVVGEGVEPIFQPAPEDEVARIREELDAPEGYVLYVGALEPRKNVGALLRAWGHAKKEHDDFPPLILAGDAGWHNRPLRRRIEELAPFGVQLLGRVDEERLVRLYQGARVFAYPSLYEGFGLPPLEAMACGVPVVVTETSSLPEVVGDAGVIVEPSSVQALSRALIDVVQDSERAEDLARRGLERARGFTWERAAAGLDEVFREAVADW